MTPNKFRKYWSEHFHQSLPLGHLFKQNFPDKWLRIHSLPKAKRYAGNTTEWDILLNRQNTLINEIITQNTVIQVVVYYIKEDNPLFKKYKFENIGVTVDKINETVYQSFWVEVLWQTDTLNDILTAIANDEIEAFIIAEGHLIAPYDGGVDLIFKEDFTINIFRDKYKNWLSERADGL